MEPDTPRSTSLLADWQYGRLRPMPDAVPSGWTFLRAIDVARLESGHTPSRKHPEYWDGDIPWLSLHDSKSLDRSEIHATAQTIGELGLANSSARLLPAGTVAFSRTATVGKATILGRQMATSQDFANYVCGPRLHNRYLMHLLRFLQPEWARLMAGSTHNTLYMPVFEGLQILLPPLPEQRNIAAVLSSVDDAMEATRAIIDQLGFVKKAMMSELLTRGLPGRHTRFKQTEIGEVPEEWDVGSLGQLCIRVTDGSHQSVKTSPTGEVPFLFVSCVRDGQIIWANAGRIPRPTYAEIARGREPKPGLILYTAVGSYGHAALVEEGTGDFAFQRHIAYVLPNAARVHEPFLAAWLNGPWCRDHADRVAVGNAQKTVTLGKLKEYPVPVPSRDEQLAIAGALSVVDARLRTENAHLNHTRNVKSALMSVLLTGEVRVKPDEEAA